MIRLAKSKNTPESAKDKKDATRIDFEKEIADIIFDENKKNDSIEDTQNEPAGQSSPEQNQEEKLTVENLSAERDKYLRLAAEYDNFRKRSAKERELIYSDARIDAISKLLPVYDNLERALKMECSDESYYKGVEMIMTQLTEALSGMGVQEIPAVGEPFDPNRHNAVMKIEDPKLGENMIAEEYQKGFAIGDRVIRFSTVVVAN